MRSVPSPSIFAPIFTRKLPRSTTSGSMAEFSSTVSPSARTAAIIMFTVAPTETFFIMKRDAPQFLCLRDNKSVLNSDFSPQGLESREVDVDGTLADGASAGKGHVRHSQARQHGPHDIHRGAHGLDEIVGNLGAAQVFYLYAESIGFRVEFGFSAQAFNHPDDGLDVRQVRHIRELRLSVGKQACHDNRKRRVFRARDGDLAL